MISAKKGGDIDERSRNEFQSRNRVSYDFCLRPNLIDTTFQSFNLVIEFLMISALMHGVKAII